MHNALLTVIDVASWPLPAKAADHADIHHEVGAWLVIGLAVVTFLWAAIRMSFPAQYVPGDEDDA